MPHAAPQQSGKFSNNRNGSIDRWRKALSTSRRRLPTRMASRTSVTPMRPLRPTPSRASCGSTATTSFLTGTDEHGQKIEQTAAREGMTARELVDRNVQRFRAMVERMNCSNDDFIRTTEPRHYRASSGDLGAHGRGRRHLPRQIFGLALGARRSLLRRERNRGSTPPASASDRRARRSNGCRRRATFFRLSAYQDKLLDLYKRIPDFVLPRERLNEVESLCAAD